MGTSNETGKKSKAWGYAVTRKTMHGEKRKPKGFWSEGAGKFIVSKYLAGEVTEDEALKALAAACEELGCPAPREALVLDLKWYAEREAKEAARAARKALGLPGIKETARSGSVRPVERVAIGEGGRVVIPAPYRQALNLKEGDEIILQLADGELRLLTPLEALRRAQELVRRYVPTGRSLAEELIEDRRQEARRERSGG